MRIKFKTNNDNSNANNDVFPLNSLFVHNIKKTLKEGYVIRRTGGEGTSPGSTHWDEFYQLDSSEWVTADKPYSVLCNITVAKDIAERVGGEVVAEEMEDSEATDVITRMDIGHQKKPYQKPIIKQMTRPEEFENCSDPRCKSNNDLAKYYCNKCEKQLEEQNKWFLIDVKISKSKYRKEFKNKRGTK